MNKKLQDGHYICSACHKRAEIEELKEIKNELLINENTPIEKIKIKC